MTAKRMAWRVMAGVKYTDKYPPVLSRKLEVES
jgi:hypothetical protein